MSMWVIRGAYVPATTVSSIMTYLEGGDLPLNGVISSTIAALPADQSSPVVIADELAAAAVLETYQVHIRDAHLSNGSN